MGKNKKSLLRLTLWEMDSQLNTIHLIQDNIGMERTIPKNTKNFIKFLKPCFRDYAWDMIVEFHLGFRKFIQAEDYIELRITMPIMLEYNKYEQAVFFFELQKGLANKNQIKILAYKKYENETYNFQVFKNQEYSEKLSALLGSRIKKPNPLTKDQSRIFHLTLAGHSTNEISEILGKSKESLLKFYPRITARLAAFFEIPFKTYHEAISYYEKSFRYK